MLGTKWPSMMSTWNHTVDVDAVVAGFDFWELSLVVLMLSVVVVVVELKRLAHAGPRFAKSAERMEGDMTVGGADGVEGMVVIIALAMFDAILLLYFVDEHLLILLFIDL